MKFTQTFTVEIPDLEMLEMINEEQDYEGLEAFETLKEIPTELIVHYLNEAQIFADIFYDEYTYDVDELTITR